jgi:hypothetical protein
MLESFLIRNPYLGSLFVLCGLVDLIDDSIFSGCKEILCMNSVLPRTYDYSSATQQDNA